MKFFCRGCFVLSRRAFRRTLTYPPIFLLKDISSRIMIITLLVLSQTFFQSVMAKEVTCEVGETKSSLLNPQIIKKLVANAYIWGLPLEFTYRFNNYNALISAPVNSLAYATRVAEWNNASTNAGSASTLYINGVLDLSGNQALVYTIPPMDGIFTVTQIIDAFTNVVADPGSRTIDTKKQHSFLLVGPKSEYANRRRVILEGFEFEVIALDTNRAELLARVLAQTLTSPLSNHSVNKTLENYAKKFTLNTLSAFQANNNIPIYPDADVYTPDDQDKADASAWKDSPTDACDFFNQIGESLVINPLPSRSVGLSGTPLKNIPFYIVPQPLGIATYYAPSAGQASTLAKFASIGLTEKGFKVPSNWGEIQIKAFYEGFDEGVKKINSQLTQPADIKTNYWVYTNQNFGVYPNTVLGYQYRSIGVIAGGFPNIPEDGFYTKQDNYSDGGELDGNNTYSITFGSSTSVSSELPIEGILPPLSHYKNGDAIGYWSLSVYQRGLGVAACPCVSQASVLNTFFTKENGKVISVNADQNANITVEVPYPGAILKESTAIMFEGDLNVLKDYGLVPGKAYYIIAPPVPSDVNGKALYTFSISETWLQDLSIGSEDAGTPIQNTGKAGPLKVLQSNSSPLEFRIIQPVVQLGSEEIKSKQLQQNLDGSYTLWLAPRFSSLPKGVEASNWIPTPSTEYLQSVYGKDTTLDTTIQPIIRIYSAQPGNNPPSILPCKGSKDCFPPMSKATGHASYLFPLINKVTP